MSEMGRNETLNHHCSHFKQTGYGTGSYVVKELNPLKKSGID